MSNPLDLHLTKFIKAERSKVFEAWTSADVMKQWLSPGELISPKAASDPKIGGAFTIEMEGMMYGKFTKGIASGTFKELVPDELVVLTWNWAGGYSPPETVITVTLKDVEGGTELTLTQTGFADEQHRGGYEAGWHSAFEKLSKFIDLPSVPAFRDLR